jgi:hypothetical protein
MKKITTLVFFACIISSTSSFCQCGADAGIDKIICAGSTTTLGPASPNSSHSYSWSPTTALSDPNIYNPVSSTTTNRTYTLTVSPKNLIPNGNFESGATGFNSDNQLDGPWYGAYYVNSNPVNVRSQWCNMPDHSASGTNMLLVDGRHLDAPSARFWYVTVNVSQNTDYKFTGFISNVCNTNGGGYNMLATIIGNVSGSTGTNQANNSITCNVWQQFNMSWNSGSNTTATLEFRFLTSVTTGNDIAIDDLFFGIECTPSTDDVTVTVAPPLPSITPVGPITYYYWYEGTIQIPLTSNRAGQWYKNNVAIPGATGTSYTATYSGNGTPTDTYKCVNFCGTSNIVTINAIGCTSESQYPVFIPPSVSCPATAAAGWTVSQVNKGPFATYLWILTYNDYWQVSDNSSRTIFINLGDVNAPWPAIEYFYTRAVHPFGSETRMSFGLGLSNGCRMALETPIVQTPEKPAVIKTALFPNPAKTKFTITSKNMLNRIEMYNSLGVLVKALTINRQNILSVQTGDLPQGLYSVRLISDNETEVVKLIVTK